MADAAAKAGVAPHDAWQALLRDKSLQFQFPDAPQQGPPPNWLIQLGRFLRDHARAFEIFGWVLLAAIVLTLGFFLVRWLLRRGLAQGGMPGRHPEPAWQPSAQQVRLLLQDADALADRGLYDQAVRLLLHVSIQEIGDRRPGAVRPAFTSREIAMLPSLSAMARRIFFEIALVVERSLFGGHPLGAAEYAQCRAAFEQFLAPDVWQAAA